MNRLMYAAAAALTLGLGAAQAAPVEIDVCADSGCDSPTRLLVSGTNSSTTVTFSNGGDTVEWGTSTGSGRSSLSLIDEPSASGNFGQSLLLGRMSYFNNPTVAGTSPTGIDLRLVFNVTNPTDGLGFLTFIFDGELTSRINPASDTLDFGSDSPVTRQWTSGGQAYLLTVWIDPESRTVIENNERAATFNIFASVNKVPVPATLALLGLGCLGLAAARRRAA